MSKKRPSNVFLAPKSKIPKLNIITSFGSPSQRQSTTIGNSAIASRHAVVSLLARNNNVIPSTSAASNNEIICIDDDSTTPNPNQKHLNDWGDDDDEDLLRATQEVENKVDDEVNRNGQPLRSGIGTANDVVVPPISEDWNTEEVAKDLANNHLIMDEWDDFFQNQNTLLQKNPVASKWSHNQSMRLSDFNPPITSTQNRPSIPGHAANLLKENIPNNGMVIVPLQASTNSDLERLQTEFETLKAMCQSRDGEIANLRKNLQEQNKIQCDIRKDKINECERIKMEFTCKLHDLTKNTEALATELEFEKKQKLKSKKSLEFIPGQLPQLMDVNISLEAERPSINIDTHLFTPIHHKNVSKQQNNINHLQNLLSKLIYQHRSLPSPHLIEQMFSTVTNGFKHIQQECNRLQSAINYSQQSSTDSLRRIRYECSSERLKHTNQQLLEGRMSIYQLEEMYDNEGMRESRRFLACVGAVCGLSEAFCTASVTHQIIENKSMWQIWCDALDMIANSTEWDLHLGVVQVSCMFLVEVSKHNDCGQRFVSSLQPLLHSILLCRPNSQSLQIIAEFLCKIATLDDAQNFLEIICKRSKSHAAIMNQKIVFSMSTCTLQIYAVLLQKEFSIRNLCKPELDRLILVTMHTMTLIENCISKSIRWICLDEVMTSESGNRSCLCYVHLVIFVTNGLFLCLRHWIEDHRSIDLCIVSELARQGIMFMYTHFYTRFVLLVFRCGPAMLSTNLYKAYNWIVSHHRLFRLNGCHLRAAEKINHFKNMTHIADKSQDAREPGFLDTDELCIEMKNDFYEENLLLSNFNL